MAVCHDGAVGHVDAYLAELPDGLNSYPQARCRAKVVSVFVADEVEVVKAALPAELRPLLLDPPPATRWVPEVHAQVVFAALRETVCESDDAFVERARGLNRALLASPLFSVVRWVRLSRIATTLLSSWRLAHRASSLRVLSLGPNHVEIEVTHPELIFPEYVVRGNLTAAEEALSASGARGVRSVLDALTPTRFSARVSWDKRVSRPPGE